MGYGFKVFGIGVTQNGRGEILPWNDAAWLHLQRAVQALLDRGPRFSSPPLRDIENLAAYNDPARVAPEGDPVLEVLHAGLVSADHMHFVISTGTKGRHADLIRDAGRSPDSVRDAAASARHRVDIWRNPETDAGIMAVESIDGSCPARLLKNHLQSASWELSLGPDPKDATKTKRLHGYAGFRITRHPDRDYLEALIKESESATAVFRELRDTASGRATHVDGELRLDLREKKRRDAAVKVADDWFRKMLDGQTVDDAVQSMIDEFEVDEAGLEALGLDVNDVALVLAPKKGSPRVYGPNLINQLFDYPVSSYRPTNETYYDRVSGRVLTLVTTYDRGITVLSGRSVASCLTDLTWPLSSARSAGVSANGPAQSVSGPTP